MICVGGGGRWSKMWRKKESRRSWCIQSPCKSGCLVSVQHKDLSRGRGSRRSPNVTSGSGLFVALSADPADFFFCCNSPHQSHGLWGMIHHPRVHPWTQLPAERGTCRWFPRRPRQWLMIDGCGLVVWHIEVYMGNFRDSSLKITEGVDTRQ